MDQEDILQKVANIDKTKFIRCSFDDIEVGDIVLSFTGTHSQKYFNRYGYEEYNMEKYGILLEKNFECPGQSIVLAYNENKDMFDRTNLYSDPGSSGWYSLQKYVG
jgi:hypothetical protein